MSRMTNLLGVPITRNSYGGGINVAASGPGSHYGFPKSAKAVEKVRKSAVAKKTRLEQ